MKRGIAYAGAALVGSGLAFLVFSSPAPTNTVHPEPSTREATPGASQVGTLRSEPLEASKLGRPGRLPVRAGGGNQSPRPRSDLPDNPNPGAEERAEHFTTPLARHGAVDGGKWIRVAQLLAEEDALELSQEARALGGKVRKAMNPHGNMNGAVLYEEERSLIEELRNAGHGDLLSEPLGMLEEALDSLEAGEPHPSDQNHEDDPEE